jgi:hypothetical protein
VVGSSLRVQSVREAWGPDVRAAVLTRPGGVEEPVLVRISPVEAAPDVMARAAEDLPELRRVTAPGVLPVEQVAAVGGRLARVYAWFDGTSLRVVLANALRTGVALPARAVIEIAGQVGIALDGGLRSSEAGHLHHAGCGPEDVLVDTAGEVRLTGFVVLRPGELLSTRPGYRSVGDADPGAYMVAALLYELLTGEVPPEPGDTPERHETIVRRMLIRALARPGDSPGEAVGQALREALGWSHASDAGSFGQRLLALATRVSGPRLGQWAATGLLAPAPVAAGRTSSASGGTPTPRPAPSSPPASAMLRAPPPAASPSMSSAGSAAVSSEGVSRQAPTVIPEPLPVIAGPAALSAASTPGPGADTFPADPTFDGVDESVTPPPRRFEQPEPAFRRGVTDPMGVGAPRARRPAGQGDGPRIGGGFDPEPGLGGSGLGGAGLGGAGVAIGGVGVALDGERPPDAAPPARKGLALSLLATGALAALFLVVVGAGWWALGGADEEQVDALPGDTLPIDAATEPPAAVAPAPATPPATTPAAPTQPAPTHPATSAPATPAKSGSAPTTPRATPSAPAEPFEDPDEPTRLAPSEEGARIAPTEPAAPAPVEPAPVAAPVELPGPFAVSFASGDPAITRLEVRCGDQAADGAPPVSIAAAPKGSCKVTGFGAAAPLLTLVTLSGDRAYTCFSGGARSCR